MLFFSVSFEFLLLFPIHHYFDDDEEKRCVVSTEEKQFTKQIYEIVVYLEIFVYFSYHNSHRKLVMGVFSDK